ncbi:hypothetical protein [Streptomyces huiliensis]|uniref:hypothetical protein n=1 Tax=Streptomyces huiliensis TaxID=2876027 RepID=UPI001CBE06A3|nr:hypothetical protein [Streptomyces huiliensis]MBZ4319590.1 hypothetical protein [Streptomyces huiliensis]
MTRIRTPAARRDPRAPRPHGRDGTAALTVAALVVLEAVALRLVPTADWPLATVALGAALAAVAVTAHALGRRSLPPLCSLRTRRYLPSRRGPRAPAPDDPLFDAATRDSLPPAALRAALPSSDPAAENRLQVAWILARHGHDAAWLRRYLDLPPGVADALVRAADAEQGPPRDANDGGPPHRAAPTPPAAPARPHPDGRLTDPAYRPPPARVRQ